MASFMDTSDVPVDAAGTSDGATGTSVDAAGTSVGATGTGTKRKLSEYEPEEIDHWLSSDMVRDTSNLHWVISNYASYHQTANRVIRSQLFTAGRHVKHLFQLTVLPRQEFNGLEYFGIHLRLVAFANEYKQKKQNVNPVNDVPEDVKRQLQVTFQVTLLDANDEKRHQTTGYSLISKGVITGWDQLVFANIVDELAESDGKLRILFRIWIDMDTKLKEGDGQPVAAVNDIGHALIKRVCRQAKSDDDTDLTRQSQEEEEEAQGQGQLDNAPISDPEVKIPGNFLFGFGVGRMSLGLVPKMLPNLVPRVDTTSDAFQRSQSLKNYLGADKVDPKTDAVVNQIFLAYQLSNKLPKFDARKYGVGVLRRAENCGLPAMKKMAEQELISALTVENAANFFLHGDLYNSTELKFGALHFMLVNRAGVEATPAFQKVLEHDPGLKMWFRPEPKKKPEPETKPVQGQTNQEAELDYYS